MRSRSTHWPSRGWPTAPWPWLGGTARRPPLSGARPPPGGRQCGPSSVVPIPPRSWRGLADPRGAARHEGPA
eukprot:6534388-Lingulodinium_polyedra.AAC.1